MRALKRFVYRNWQKVHGVRRLELAVLTRYLELDGRQRILDVGSGKGALCGALARSGQDVVGVDPSPPAAAIAKTYVNPAGDFVLGGGEALPFSDEIDYARVEYAGATSGSTGWFRSVSSSTRKTIFGSCGRSAAS